MFHHTVFLLQVFQKRQVKKLKSHLALKDVNLEKYYKNSSLHETAETST